AERPSGRFIGTRGFASPEQIQSRPIDSRSDIYSLAATLWYSLTGKLPARAQEGSNSISHLEPNAVDSSSSQQRQTIPASLTGLLESALAFNPNDRPTNALEFGQKLQNCLDDLASIPGVNGGPKPRRRNRRWALTAAGVAIVATLLGELAVFQFKRLPRPERSIAVLPFRNLSDHPADTAFADGVQRDLLSRLRKVHNLKITNLVAATGYS